MKKKVLFAIPSFLMGGIEKQLVQQLHLFDRDKYELFLVTLFQYPGRKNLYNRLPDDVHLYSFAFSGYGDWKNLIKIYKLIKSIAPDLVVSSMFSANLLFGFLKIFIDFKLTIREHNTYFDRNFFQKIINYFLANIADRVVAVSHQVKDFLSRQSRIKKNKIIVINNGVDVELIKNFQNNNEKTEIKKRLSLGNEKIILNVARLKKHKNHKLLIDAFAIFTKDHPEYKLVIVGDGQEKNNLENYLKLKNIKDKVWLTGERNDVFDFYFIADFFILPSAWEGFPNVAVEALAFGLPILMSDVGGASEIIKSDENGFLVEKNSFEFFSAMEKMVYKLSEQEDFIRDFCKKSVEIFDIRKIVKNYENLFDEVMKTV